MKEESLASQLQIYHKQDYKTTMASLKKKWSQIANAAEARTVASKTRAQ